MSFVISTLRSDWAEIVVGHVIIVHVPYHVAAQTFRFIFAILSLLLSP